MSRLRRFKRLLQFIREAWRDGKIVSARTPDGLDYYWVVNHRYPQAMSTGNYEIDCLKALQSLLKQGQTFFDIGANSGYFSLLAKIIVGNGRVLAFEPLPENVRMIEAVKQANPGHPFDVIAAAVAGRDGKARFYITRNNANGRLAGIEWKKSKPPVREVEVKTVALLPYINCYQPHVIKIDVEGAEYEILSTLGSPSAWTVTPAFLMEFHGEAIASQCTELFLRWGYDLYTLEGVKAENAASSHHLIARTKC